MNKILIANRGAVAARVARAVHEMGLRSVVVYSEADRDLPYVQMADEAYCIGPAPAAQSYLDQAALLDVLARTGADAVHPGYGFLSENAGFARAVDAAGAVFIGPAARWIEAMGHKTRARELMARHGMPMCKSSAVLGEDEAGVLAAAREVGYPVMVKPAGGGGIGMIAAAGEAELLAAVARARSLAARSFGNGDIYLEQLFEQPRHIEFQILADRHGNARHLYERDCSVQRRHQKVIEEARAPRVPTAETQALGERIAALLAELGYDVIGTVEMLRDQQGRYSFLEMNTRLQVEHAVTEAITGLDLVQAQIRLAAGERLDRVVPADLQPSGHAIELRVYAEDPVRFIPSPGTLAVFELPQGPGVRTETGYRAGNAVSPHYDPMIAKIIVHGADRAQAIARAEQALADTEIAGVKTNLPFLARALAFEPWRQGRLHTGIVARTLAEPAPAALTA
ncbi:D-alanine--D-alanine ligase C-terminal domain protein [Bordetella bronchiseptica MBORD678]|uniref:acetyl-CoA carboxylase biotin carboxylase subunit n=1 Tax=Bordetella bronchiseptica TaxID=518 RepID=UPI00049FF531|nr:biotin carboxylase N-terminal domain-containing protein [Bordetella bronchiseptica]KDD82770.1 D-alanine--D-alanine ligase C-terminal domain protein [Bordetella bronchiseptica MBORD678]